MDQPRQPEPLTPAVIKVIREALGLSQEEAGNLLGGGPRAFQKYEAGTIAPAAATENLLRLLYADPSRLAELTGQRPAAATLPPGLAISDADVVSLSPAQLQSVMRALITAEGDAAGVPHRWEHAPDQTDAPDQGEDARVSWAGSIARTEFLPGRTILFQFKATAMARQKCIREVVTDTGVKPRIRDVLTKADGAYVLAVSRSMTQHELDNRLDAMRDAVRSAIDDDAAARVHLYSATQISGWINRHPAVALSILEILARSTPLRTFSGWARRPEHSVIPFQSDKRLERVVGEFKVRLSRPGSVLRLVGASGIGKSRLAIEALQTKDLAALRSKTIFADLGEAASDDLVRGALQRLADQRVSALAVIENCPPEAHERLASLVRHSSTLSLLTIDHDPEDASEKDLFKLTAMESDCVDRIVRTAAPSMSESERQRILQYAAGNAQIARLLAEVSAQGENLATASDLHLAKSVALGRRRGDGEALLVAEYIALFGLVRIDDDQPADLDYLHSIGAPGPITFRRHVGHLLSRGTAQRRGGLIMLVPRPVALNLAANLWATWDDRARDAALIKAGASRRSSLLRQIARLDAFEPAVKAAARTMKISGPLDVEDALRSPVIVSIISCLAELAPAAAERLLRHLFSAEKDLREVRDNARRELVHALEKLAFRAATFETAALLMLELAVAENESWGNNATGKFGDYFPLLLADTEAGPEPRLRVIAAAIGSNSRPKLEMAVKALTRAVSTSHFSRSVGPENQGSAPPMEPWRPQTYGEQRDYLASFLAVFAELAERDDDIGAMARAELGHHIIDLLQQGLIDQVEAAVDRVLSAKSYFWIEALESVQRALATKPNGPPPEVRDRLVILRERLQPTDLASRLRFSVTESPWGLLYHDDEDTDEASLSERLVRPARQLARELAGDPEQLTPHLPSLVRRQQRQAFAFGDTLAREAADPKLLLTPILAATAVTPEREMDSALLGGYLHGLNQRDVSQVETTLEACAQIPETRHLLPYLTAVVGVTSARLARLRELAVAKEINPWHFAQLAGGRALDDLPPSDVGPFLSTLIDAGGDAYAVAIQVLGMYTHGRLEHLDSMRETVRAIYDHLDVSALNDARGGMTGHVFTEITKWLLARGAGDKDASAAALTLAQSIQQRLEDDDLDALEDILIPLLRDFGTLVWPILGAVATEPSVASYRLQSMLGEIHSFDHNAPPPILHLPETLLLAWCGANPIEGPRFLARTLPALGGADASGEKTWHPLTRKLIDQFGKDKTMLDALHSRMFTFGWTGSLTTYFAMYVKPLSSLLDHPIDVVRHWARTVLDEIEATIEDQQKRDDEQEAIWDS